jgi:hypothetical protein
VPETTRLHYSNRLGRGPDITHWDIFRKNRLRFRLLLEAGREAPGREFDTVRAFVRFAENEKLGLDFTTPPRRPDASKLQLQSDVGFIPYPPGNALAPRRATSRS